MENVMSKTTNSKSMVQTDIDRKKVAVEFFKLIAEGKFKEGLKFFTPDCKTHNPCIPGGMDALTDGMIAASKGMTMDRSKADFIIKHILVDGDLVIVHTQLLFFKSNPGKGGLRQAHIFRFEGDKIAEYWDITQQIMENMPNAKGAF
jgi:predicted SnoaL-like aldol condensation-catalyzing enzyme